MISPCGRMALVAASGLPLLHIAEATTDILAQQGVVRVGLLGTQFTMEKPFCRQLLEALRLSCLSPSSVRSFIA